MLKDYDITVIGDSITKGLFLENNKIMKIKNNAVNLFNEYFNIKTDNLSFFGQTLKKTVAKGYIDNYIANNANKNNKVVVISLGGNDSDYNWEKVGENPYAEHQPNTEPQEFYEILNCVIHKLQNAKIHVCLTSLPPVLSNRYFEKVISKRADKKNVLQFFSGDVTNIARHHECYNNLILKAALYNNLPFIDYRTDFLLKNDMPSYICEDGIHPNEKGHALMFSRIKEFTNNTNFSKIPEQKYAL